MHGKTSEHLQIVDATKTELSEAEQYQKSVAHLNKCAKDVAQSNLNLIKAKLDSAIADLEAYKVYFESAKLRFWKDIMDLKSQYTEGDLEHVKSTAAQHKSSVDYKLFSSDGTAAAPCDVYNDATNAFNDAVNYKSIYESMRSNDDSSIKYLFDFIDQLENPSPDLLEGEREMLSTHSLHGEPDSSA